jgi:predicted Zn-ribbon and HTH transcriptional regulator
MIDDVKNFADSIGETVKRIEEITGKSVATFRYNPSTCSDCCISFRDRPVQPAEACQEVRDKYPLEKL